MPYNHYMEHGDGGIGVLGVLWIVLLAVLVIGLIVALFRWGSAGGFSRSSSAPAPTAPPERGESPIEILDRRLAAGEIEVADYEQRRAVLTGAPGSPGDT